MVWTSKDRVRSAHGIVRGRVLASKVRSDISIVIQDLCTDGRPSPAGPLEAPVVAHPLVQVEVRGGRMQLVLLDAAVVAATGVVAAAAAAAAPFPVLVEESETLEESGRGGGFGGGHGFHCG